MAKRTIVSINGNMMCGACTFCKASCPLGRPELFTCKLDMRASLTRANHAALLASLPETSARKGAHIPGRAARADFLSGHKTAAPVPCALSHLSAQAGVPACNGGRRQTCLSACNPSAPLGFHPTSLLSRRGTHTTATRPNLWWPGKTAEASAVPSIHSRLVSRHSVWLRVSKDLLG